MASKERTQESRDGMKEVTKYDHAKHVQKDGGYSELQLVVNPGDREIRVIVRVCEQCRFILGAVCEHTKNTWNEDGTKLTCNFCGQDGT